MNAPDQLLIDKLKRAIANLNQRAADLGASRDAIIESIKTLASTVERLENKDRDKDNPDSVYRHWSY